jgi:hypothetical protein
MSIRSKSSKLHQANDTPVCPRATAEISAIGNTATISGQRIEQMYELADILVSIFEALPDEHEHAIAATPKAA